MDLAGDVGEKIGNAAMDQNIRIDKAVVLTHVMRLYPICHGRKEGSAAWIGIKLIRPRNAQLPCLLLPILTICEYNELDRRMDERPRSQDRFL